MLKRISLLVLKIAVGIVLIKAIIPGVFLVGSCPLGGWIK